MHELQRHRDQRRTVKVAPMPPQLIPQGIVTPEQGATIIDKFCDALSLCRQSAIYKRIGIDISRGILSRWVIMAAEKCNTRSNVTRPYVLLVYCFVWKNL